MVSRGLLEVNVAEVLDEEDTGAPWLPQLLLLCLGMECTMILVGILGVTMAMMASQTTLLHQHLAAAQCSILGGMVMA
jgi:hypothetical protein